uniref:Uncharacterized protein n=1 Tax=Chenopodium quinoa TaxID=63459 RepID=A0A803LAG9_CHEQI
MSCFCFGGSSSQHSKESKRITGKLDNKEPNTAERVDDIEVIDDSLPVEKRLSYQEIEIATKKFNPECLVEEAGIYVKVYRDPISNAMALAKNLAGEWAKDNIKVNSVVLGVIWSGLTEVLVSFPMQHFSGGREGKI